MPPAAVGAAFVAMGASAAAGAAITTIATSVYVGAAIGAVVGAGVAAVTGGDIIEGALKGAAIGGITKGIGTGFSLAAEGASAVEGVGTAAMEGVETAGAELGHIANAAPAAESAGAELGHIASAGGSVAKDVATNAAQEVGKQTSGGILSNAVGWLNDNPAMTEIAGKTIAGAAEGALTNRAKQKELEAAMERDKLNIQSQKVSGLDAMKLKVALPSIGNFTDTPTWQSPGLIKEAQNATA